MAAPNSNSNALSLPVVIAALSLLFVLIGGIGTAIWAVSQSQLNSLTDKVKENKDSFERNDEAIRRMVERRIADLTAELAFQRTRIIDGRKEVFGQDEFKQFEVRVSSELDVIRKQLAVLEQTRPTTGELQAASRNSQDTATKLEDRVRALEQYLLGQSKAFAPIQPR